MSISKAEFLRTLQRYKAAQDNTVSAKLDPATDNILTVSASGLKGTAKVAGATQGNIATFGANGAIIDSGFTVAADADINTMLTNVFGASS